MRNDGTIIIAYFEVRRGQGSGDCIAGAIAGLPAARMLGDEGSVEARPVVPSAPAAARRSAGASCLHNGMDRGRRAKRATEACALQPARRNVAMRALANKFGAHLTFSQGESTGRIDVIKRSAAIASVAVRIREHARGCTHDCGFQ